MNFSVGIFQEFLWKLNEMKLNSITLLKLEINSFSVDIFTRFLYQDSYHGFYFGHFQKEK